MNSFYFFNMNFSVTIQYFDLKFSVYDPNIHFEGSVSQNLDLGPSFYFMPKNG